MKTRYILAAVVAISVIQACDDPFSYSPFEADVRPAFRNLNEVNLQKISALDTIDNNLFKVALISDTHYHFDKLADAIADINSKGYSFIIATGDFTENGLLKEYEIFHQIMSAATIPYVAVIGNHDHLANGASIFQKMYGPLNFTFGFQHATFVAWDNTVWESYTEPDLHWLDQALDSASQNSDVNESFRPVILVTHIELHNDQLADKQDELSHVLNKYPVALSCNGHGHSFYTAITVNNIPHVNVGSVQHRGYGELIINEHEIIANKVEY